ncbi:MAG: cytochrome c [Thermoleophilia bacterium]|nr:cytochrome c [Thermoleophilia bacterium]
MRGRALLLVLALLAGVAAGGCGSAEVVSPTAESVEGETTTAGPTGTETETTAEESQPAAQGDPEAGRGVFDANCATCHTLEEAEATGSVGPNLDESQPEYEMIVETVTNGRGNMPPFEGQLSEEEIQNVSAFVYQATHGGG